jgi:hypothetical protein
VCLWFGADDNSPTELVSVVSGEDDDNGISQCIFEKVPIVGRN